MESTISKAVNIGSSIVLVLSYSIVRKIVFGGHREAALAAVAIHEPHHGRSPGLLRFARNDDDSGYVHNAID